MRTILALVLIATLAPTRATAQEPAVAARPPSDINALLMAQAGLHAADMITSAYALHLSRDAREVNPLLRGISAHPVALAAVSGGIDLLQTYTISKLQRHHPKAARVWAATLVGLEAWMVTQNVLAVGELQRHAVR